VPHLIDQENFRERQPRANKLKLFNNNSSLSNIDTFRKIKQREDIYDQK